MKEFQVVTNLIVEVLHLGNMGSLEVTAEFFFFGAPVLHSHSAIWTMSRKIANIVFFFKYYFCCCC